MFKDSEFVNEIMFETAMQFANDPRAMMAEAAALLLKLIFIKCPSIVKVEGVDTNENASDL